MRYGVIGYTGKVVGKVVGCAVIGYMGNVLGCVLIGYMGNVLGRGVIGYMGKVVVCAVIGYMGNVVWSNLFECGGVCSDRLHGECGVVWSNMGNVVGCGVTWGKC